MTQGTAIPFSIVHPTGRGETPGLISAGASAHGASVFALFEVSNRKRPIAPRTTISVKETAPD